MQPAAQAAPQKDDAPRLVHCKTFEEFFLPASRALIGSLCRPFLDQMVLTPTELLHSARSQTRFEGAGNLLRESVEKAAGMQARAVGESAVARMRELTTLCEQLGAAAREIEKNEKAIDLKPGSLLQQIGQIRASASGALAEMRINRMLTEYLGSVRNWTEKLERTIALMREVINSPEVGYIDTILGEIIPSDAAQESLFNRRIGTEQKIEDLIDLHKGVYPSRKNAQPSPIAVELNTMLQKAPLPELRGAIETAIVQHLAGRAPMSSPELMMELKSTYGLLAKLRAGDKVIGGRRALEFIDKRMARLINHESITDYVRGATALGDRLIALLDIYAVTFGPANRKTVEGFITRYFGDEDFERRLMSGEGSNQHKLKMLTTLHRAVMTAPLSTQDKQTYATRFARIQANFIAQSRLFATIEKQNASSARKCGQVILLCLDGHFIAGENLERAKALIAHYLARPDFLERYLEGAANPAMKKELLGTLRKQLDALGIPPPFPLEG